MKVALFLIMGLLSCMCSTESSNAVAMYHSIYADSVQPRDGDAGVTIAGVDFKHGMIYAYQPVFVDSTVFANTVSEYTSGAGVAVGGVTLKTGGMTLANGATVLNYYEEATHTTNWSGAFSSAQAGNVFVTRIGRQVLLFFPQMQTTCNANTAVTSVTVLPTKFRPSGSNSVYKAVLVMNNSVPTVGHFSVNPTTGAMIFSIVGGSFTAAGTCGPYSGTIIYSV